jgi:hypothetical protein
MVTIACGGGGAPSLAALLGGTRALLVDDGETE